MVEKYRVLDNNDLLSLLHWRTQTDWAKVWYGTNNYLYHFLSWEYTTVHNVSVLIWWLLYKVHWQFDLSVFRFVRKFDQKVTSILRDAFFKTYIYHLSENGSHLPFICLWQNFWLWQSWHVRQWRCHWWPYHTSIPTRYLHFITKQSKVT